MAQRVVLPPKNWSNAPRTAGMVPGRDGEEVLLICTAAFVPDSHKKMLDY